LTIERPAGGPVHDPLAAEKATVVPPSVYDVPPPKSV
jgi:hypothetical protein